MLLYDCCKNKCARVVDIMEERKLVIADLSVLPPVYHKVLLVKELLDSGKAETVNDAAAMAKVSRSAYYKYKDFVFPFNQMQGILTLLVVTPDVLLRCVISLSVPQCILSVCTVTVIFATPFTGTF